MYLIFFLLTSAASFTLANLSPQKILAVFQCQHQTINLTIQPQAFEQQDCDLPVSVIWNSTSYSGQIVANDDTLKVTVLNSIPMIAAKGNVIIDGKVRERISEGSTINLGERMFRVTSVYQNYLDMDRGYSELHFQYSQDNGQTFTPLAQDNSTKLVIPEVQDQNISLSSGIASLCKLQDGSILLGFLSKYKMVKNDIKGKKDLAIPLLHQMRIQTSLQKSRTAKKSKAYRPRSLSKNETSKKKMAIDNLFELSEKDVIKAAEQI